MNKANTGRFYTTEQLKQLTQDLAFLRYFPGLGMNAQDSLGCRVFLPAACDLRAAIREFEQYFDPKYPSFNFVPGRIDTPPKHWIALTLLKGKEMGNLESKHFAEAKALESDLETWAKQRGGHLGLDEDFPTDGFDPTK